MAKGRALTGLTPQRGAKSGGGGKPRPSAHVQESLHRAREKGHTALEKAVNRLADALDATNGDGDPDHGIRIRASAELMDRFGIPKRTELITEDQNALMLAEVGAKLRELAGK